mmetsp:Transcript_4974/g.17439  ORF Transcript_4974/g.17439 Transcript_4974/m.17439 type:complete len:278 (-) Transcript_4974:147-980(-)
MAAIVELRRRTRAVEARARGVRVAAMAEGREEDWTRCPKMHSDVQEALGLARTILEQLGEEEDENNFEVDASSEDHHTFVDKEDEGNLAKRCLESLHEVQGKLRRLDLPTFARPAATLRAAATRTAQHDDLKDQEAPGTPEAIRIPTYAQPELSKSRRHVTDHMLVHEDLSEEILEMTRKLKENAVTFRGRLEQQGKQLDEAESKVEKNVASARDRNKQAKAFYKRNWSTSCQSYLILFWVAVAFAATVVFLKTSSIAGYSAAKAAKAAAGASGEEL